MKFRLRSLFSVVAIAAFVIVAALWLKHVFVGSSGANVSAKSANRYIWASLRLPASATDVTYTTDSYGCEAGFAISETEFTQWCKTNGWRMAPITSPNVYFGANRSRSIAGKGRVVGSGFHFYPPDGEGTFDADQSRAEFWVSTFP